MEGSMTKSKPFHETIVETLEFMGTTFSIGYNRGAVMALVELLIRSTIPADHDLISSAFARKFEQFGIPVPKGLMQHITAEKERCAREAEELEKTRHAGRVIMQPQPQEEESGKPRIKFSNV
jgi:hypothetical protein